MRVMALVGGNRKDSYNKKLAIYMQNRYQEKLDIEILPIEELPMYNQDDETNPPAIVTEIKNKVAESDGILFVTPEYNHSIPAVLKNAIDWLSRMGKVLAGKPAMIVGATVGTLGTVRAQMHLRQILNSPGCSCFTLPGNEVLINQVEQKFDEAGNLTHQPTVEFIDTVVDNFIAWANKQNK